MGDKLRQEQMLEAQHVVDVLQNLASAINILNLDQKDPVLVSLKHAHSELSTRALGIFKSMDALDLSTLTACSHTEFWYTIDSQRNIKEITKTYKIARKKK